MSGWPGGPATRAAAVEKEVTVFAIGMLLPYVETVSWSQSRMYGKHVAYRRFYNLGMPW